jgi:hypothetical protein
VLGHVALKILLSRPRIAERSRHQGAPLRLCAHASAAASAMQRQTELRLRHGFVLRSARAGKLKEPSSCVIFEIKHLASAT